MMRRRGGAPSTLWLCRAMINCGSVHYECGMMSLCLLWVISVRKVPPNPRIWRMDNDNDNDRRLGLTVVADQPNYN